jgi:hypothetical protein
MIKLTISEPRSRPWRQWRSDCRQKTAADIQGYRPGSKVSITDLYKKQKTFFTSYTRDA